MWLWGSSWIKVSSPRTPFNKGCYYQNVTMIKVQAARHQFKEGMHNRLQSVMMPGPSCSTSLIICNRDSSDNPQLDPSWQQCGKPWTKTGQEEASNNQFYLTPLHGNTAKTKVCRVNSLCSRYDQNSSQLNTRHSFPQTEYLLSAGENRWLK
jgi:hypothetical protein